MNKAELLTADIYAMLATNQAAGCPCPERGCDFHGKCYECVRIHRHYADHLPSCLQFIVKDKLAALAETAEMQVVPKPPTAEEFWDRVCRKREDEG